MLCLYERGIFMDTNRPTGALTVAHFNLEWLTDGADSLPKPPSN